MHRLAAPGSLWVLSNDGKYLARPQAGETSHKFGNLVANGDVLQTFLFCGRGFALAGATKGLSDRSATSIVAAFRRSFRLRKAGMHCREAGCLRLAQSTSPP